MVERGDFGDERVELLRGELVPMSPQGPMHIDVVAQLVELLVVALAGRASVRPQGPLAMADHSEPEPDIAVVPRGRYLEKHPVSAYLVIEVADSSLSKDRVTKAVLYAESGVPEYWIVNLPEQVIEVRSQPRDGVYRKVETRRRGEVLAPIAFPDVGIAVDDIL